MFNGLHQTLHNFGMFHQGMKQKRMVMTMERKNTRKSMDGKKVMV